MQPLLVLQLVIALSAGAGCYSSSPKTTGTSPTSKTNKTSKTTGPSHELPSSPPVDDDNFIHTNLPQKKPIPSEDLDRVRVAYVKGRVLEWVVEEVGKPESTHRWEITLADQRGATIKMTTRDKAGAVVGFDYTDLRPWEDLLEYALRAPGYTVERDVTITVPAGTFVTTLYTERSPVRVTRAWYSKDEPGILVQSTAEADGKQTSRMRATRIR